MLGYALPQGVGYGVDTPPPSEAEQVNTLGEGNFTRGLKSSLYQTDAASAAMDRVKALQAGDIPAAEQHGLRSHALSEKAALYAPTVGSIYDVHGPMDAGSYLAGMAGGLPVAAAPAVAGGLAGGLLGRRFGPLASSIGGTAGSIAGMALPETNNAVLQQMHEQEAGQIQPQTPEEILRNARTKGWVKGTIYGGAGPIGSTVRSVAGGGARLAAREAIPGLGARIGHDALLGAGTMAGAELAGQALDTSVNPNRDKSRDTEALINAGVTGGVLGAPFGAVGHAADVLHSSLEGGVDAGSYVAGKVWNGTKWVAGKAVDKDAPTLQEAWDNRPKSMGEAAIMAGKGAAAAHNAVDDGIDRLFNAGNPELNTLLKPQKGGPEELMADDTIVRHPAAADLADRILKDPNASPELKRAAQEYQAGPQTQDAWKPLATAADNARYGTLITDAADKINQLAIKAGQGVAAAHTALEDAANVYTVARGKQNAQRPDSAGPPEAPYSPIEGQQDRIPLNALEGGEKRQPDSFRSFDSLLARQLFDSRDYRFADHPDGFFNVAAGLRTWMQNGFPNPGRFIEQLRRITDDPAGVISKAYDLTARQGLVKDAELKPKLAEVLDRAKSTVTRINEDTQLLGNSLTPLAHALYGEHDLTPLASVLRRVVATAKWKNRAGPEDVSKVVPVQTNTMLDKLFGPQKEAVLEHFSKQREKYSTAAEMGEERKGAHLSDEARDAHETGGGTHEELEGLGSAYSPSEVGSRVQYRYHNQNLERPYELGNDAHDEAALKHKTEMAGKEYAPHVRAQRYIDHLREKYANDPAAMDAALERVREEYPGKTLEEVNKGYYVLRDEVATDKHSPIDIPGEEFSAISHDAKSNVWGESTGKGNESGGPEHGKIWFERVAPDGRVSTFATSAARIIKRMREAEKQGGGITEKPGLAGQHDLIAAGITAMLDSRMDDGRYALSGRWGFMKDGEVKWHGEEGRSHDLGAEDTRPRAERTATAAEEGAAAREESKASSTLRERGNAARTSREVGNSLPDNLRLYGKAEDTVGRSRSIREATRVNEVKQELRDYIETAREGDANAARARAALSGNSKNALDVALRYIELDKQGKDIQGEEGSTFSTVPPDMGIRTDKNVGTKGEVKVKDTRGQKSPYSTPADKQVERGNSAEQLAQDKEFGPNTIESRERKKEGELYKTDDRGYPIQTEGSGKLVTGVKEPTMPGKVTYPAGEAGQRAWLYDRLQKGVPALLNTFRSMPAEKQEAVRAGLRKILGSLNPKVDPSWLKERATNALEGVSSKAVVEADFKGKTMAMKFSDGTNFAGIEHTMRPEFAGKSTLDLIQSGDRTASTRVGIPNVHVGETVRMIDGRGGHADVKITKAPYQLKWYGDARDAVNAEKWSKLEGWSPEVYKHYAEKGAWQFQYEQTGVQDMRPEPPPLGVKKNAQRPSLANTKRATPEELKAADEAITTRLGPQMKRAFLDDIGGHSADWTPDAQGNVIRIATNAVGGVHTNALHESMHEFFDRLQKGKQDDVAALLTKVTSSGILTRSLERILDGHSEAIASLKDPAERLAYAYQFWEAGHPLLRIGPQTEGFFAKVAKFLRKVTGLLRDDEKAEAIFRQFKEGKLQDASVAGKVLAKLNNSERRVQAVANATEPFRRHVTEWIGSAEDNLNKSSNPALRTVGALFTDHNNGEIQARDRAGKQWMGKLKQALLPFEKDDIQAALEGLQTGKWSDDPTIRKVQENVDGFLKEIHPYLEKAGVSKVNEETGAWEPIGKIKDHYFPRSWNVDELYKRGPEFVGRLMKEHQTDLEIIAARANDEVKAGISAGRGTASDTIKDRAITAQDIADSIYQRLMLSSGQEGQHGLEEDGYSLGFSPMMKAVNKRTLKWIDMSKFSDFQNKDITNIMSTYVMQATKRAEYTRRFGPDGGKLQALMDRAERHGTDAIMKEKYGVADAMNKAEGAMRAVKALNGTTTLADELSRLTEQKAKGADIIAESQAKLKQAQRAVMAMEGTLGHDISPTLRKAQGWVLAYENVRMLPMALFANLIDPLGILVRGGELTDVFKTYKDGISDVINSWRGKEREDNVTQMLELAGVLDAHGFMTSMGDMANSVYLQGGARKINDALFQMNGMEALNRSMRGSAGQAAIGFIKRHALNPNEHSERLLKELNLDAAYVKRHISGADGPSKGLDVTDPRIQNAIAQWVNEAILRPNAAVRPTRLSDPHWALLGMYKGFMYAMHKQILTRAANEARLGNYTPASTLALGYVPVMMAADMTKLILQNALAGNAKMPAWWEAMDAKDRFEYATERAGMLGPGQMLRDGFEYGPSAIGGPVVEQLIGAFKDPAGKTITDAMPWYQFFSAAQRAVTD